MLMLILGTRRTTFVFMSMLKSPTADLIKNKFVSPTTFWRVEMCHQYSVIRDIKLGQKRE